MPNFKDIDEARKLLGIGKAATLKEMKTAYRRLANLHHPDKQDRTSEKDAEKMKKLNRAYKVLIDYCGDYRYSFSEEDVTRTYPHEEYMRKWGENWFNSI